MDRQVWERAFQAQVIAIYLPFTAASALDQVTPIAREQEVQAG